MPSREQIIENRRRWVEELRSGRRKQAQQVLRRGDTFCCLGVWCDIRVDDDAGWVTVDPDEYGNRPTHGYRSEPDWRAGATEMLTRPLAYELGMSMGFTQDLAKKNDNGMSFEDLADFLVGAWGEDLDGMITKEAIR